MSGSHAVMYMIVLILIFLGACGFAYLFYADSIKLEKSLETINKEIEKKEADTAKLIKGNPDVEQDMQEKLNASILPPRIKKRFDMYMYNFYSRGDADAKLLMVEYLGNQKIEKLISELKEDIAKIKKEKAKYEYLNRKAMQTIVSAYDRVIPILQYDRTKPYNEAIKSGGRYPYYQPKDEWTKDREKIVDYIAGIIFGDFPQYDQDKWSSPKNISGPVGDKIAYYLTSAYLYGPNINWTVTRGDLIQYLKMFPPEGDELVVEPAPDDKDSKIKINVDNFFSSEKGKAILPNAIATIIVLGPKLYQDHLLYGELFEDRLFQGAELSKDSFDKGGIEGEAGQDMFKNIEDPVMQRGITLPYDDMKKILTDARKSIETELNNARSNEAINELFNSIVNAVEGSRDAATGLNVLEPVYASKIWEWIKGRKPDLLLKVADAIAPDDTDKVNNKLNSVSINSIAGLENVISDLIAERIYKKPKEKKEGEDEPLLGMDGSGPGPLASQDAIDEIKNKMKTALAAELDQIVLKDWDSLRQYKMKIGEVFGRFVIRGSKASAMDMASVYKLTEAEAKKLTGEDNKEVLISGISLIRKDTVTDLLNSARNMSAEQMALVRKIDNLNTAIKSFSAEVSDLNAKKEAVEADIKNIQSQYDIYVDEVNTKITALNEEIKKIQREIDIIRTPVEEAEVVVENKKNEEKNAGLTPVTVKSQGIIMSVDRSLKLAFIDIGKKHRVEEGMMLMVFRLDESNHIVAKGMLKVTKPYDGYSIAKIVREYEGGVVGSEDLVGSPIYNKERPLHIIRIGRTSQITEEDLKAVVKRTGNVFEKIVSDKIDIVVLGTQPTGAKETTEYKKNLNDAIKYNLLMITVEDFMFYNPDKYE